MTLFKKLLAAVCAASVMALSLGGRGIGEARAAESWEAPAIASARMTSMHQWIVDWMMSVSPPGITYVKEARETEEEGRRRYEQIADSVISVAYDEREKPVLDGPYGRAMTAALLVSVSFMESSFRKDVDYGLGPLARGDSGQSWCLAQIWMGRPGPSGRTATRVVFDGQGVTFVKDPSGAVGWGGEDMVRDRSKCFRTAIRVIRMSFNSCRRLPVDQRLAMYTSGKDSCTVGRDASEARVRLAQRWLAKRKPPLRDSEAIDLLRPSTAQSLPSRTLSVLPPSGRPDRPLFAASGGA